MSNKVKTAEIILEYANTIDGPPMTHEDMWKRATNADGPTIEMWRETWLKNTAHNHKTFGSFAEHGLGQLYNKHLHQPCILAGAGPSLKLNAHLLKDRPEGMILVSCLHNFHFMEEMDANVDYYVSLDAGPVVLEEVCEGGTKDESWYWERTKGRKLLAYIGSDPRLFEKWQGEVFLFASPIPDEKIREEIKKLEIFNTHVSSGGHVLGASLHIAKGQLGCGSIVWVGADYSFSNIKKHTFHAWDSKYDKDLGQWVAAVDIYGNRVKTWQSYYNFKVWTDLIVQRCPGDYINCTEGGILGAYQGGNIRQIKQMDLEHAYKMFNNSSHLKEQCLDPKTAQLKILF